MSWEKIRAAAFDVDGVFTDGGVWWGEDGAELKRFSFRDIMGLARATRAGFPVALISGEDSELVTRLAKKTGLSHVWRGSKNKAHSLTEFAEKLGLTTDQISFMGDDVNDLPALRLAGLAAAPADAHSSVLAMAKIVTVKKAGDGAVREFLDELSTGNSVLRGYCETILPSRDE